MTKEEKRKITHKKWLEKNKEKLKAKRKKHYEDNKEIYLQRVREWVAKNPNARKNNRLKATYGITLEQYNLMFDEQNGCCRCCGKHQSELDKPLCVDHDHKSEKVRGLLCTVCNLAIGYTNDNIQILSNMIDYLKSNYSDDERINTIED